MLNEDQTKAAIEATTGERVTDDSLDAAITQTTFYTHSRKDGGVLDICVLDLRNGFTVTGESACVDPSNYNQDIGYSIAFRNASAKIWALEGYALAERRYAAR